MGENTLLCAQTGLAGSSVVGNNVILAGQTGVAGHCTVGDGVILTAQSGISHDIPAGKTISGSPGFDNRVWLRAVTIFQRLPELLKRLDRLEKKLAAAESSRNRRRPEVTVRWGPRRGILAGILVSALAWASGCHSYHVDVTVENRTGGAIQLLEVDYPSASFGADSLAAGAGLPLSHPVARRRADQGAVHRQRRAATADRRTRAGRAAGGPNRNCAAAWRQSGVSSPTHSAAVIKRRQPAPKILNPKGKRLFAALARPHLTDKKVGG